MDKISLDITKYSCRELEDIFNIPSSSDMNSVNNRLNKLKNTIISNETLTLREKDNISNFLTEALKKLTSNSDTNLTYQSPINNILSDAPNEHPIIADQNSLAGLKAKTYDGDTSDIKEYLPGYINPINKKTIKRVINIDTRFRDSYYNTKSSDIIVTLPEEFKKVVEMKLSALNLPLSIYTLSSSLNNNFFHIDRQSDLPSDLPSDSQSDISLIELEDGKYTSDHAENTGITRKMNEYLIRSGISDISFSIDKISGKSKFTLNQDKETTIHFNLSRDGKEDFNTALPLKFGWLLGFRLGSYTFETSGQIIESEGICSLTFPKYLFFCVNDYTNAANNHFISAFSKSIMSPHILSRINYQSIVLDNGIFNVSSLEDEILSRTYFGPVNIQRLHFQIMDEFGRIIDLNNMDWSCSLTLEMLYN